jgi:hypothetical protein
MRLTARAESVPAEILAELLVAKNSQTFLE